MKISTALVDEPISTDMDHLPGNIIDDDRATRCRMNVRSRRIARVHVVHRRELLTILDRLGNLLRRPPTRSHLVLPLLSRMIAAEPPTRLAAGVMHQDPRVSDR